MLRKDVYLNAFLLQEGSCIISETEQIWAQSVLEWKMCNKNSPYYEKGHPCLGLVVIAESVPALVGRKHFRAGIASQSHSVVRLN